MSDWQTVLRRAGTLVPEIANELEAVIAVLGDVERGLVDEARIRQIVKTTPQPPEDADPDEEVPDVPHPIVAALEQEVARAERASPEVQNALWATLRVLPKVLDRLRSVVLGAPLPSEGPGSMRGRLAELERDVSGDGTSPWPCPRCGSRNVAAQRSTWSARPRWEVRCLRCGLSAAFYEDAPEAW